MPDFERLTDKLRIDLAPTEEIKSYWTGYVDGKSVGRIQGALICGLIILASVLMALL